jgi:integrase/recombinase XerD
MEIETALKMLADAEKAEGHRPRTKASYKHCVSMFFSHIKGWESFTAKDMQRYFLHLLDEKKHKMVASTVNLHQDALGFFFNTVLNRPDLMVGIKHIPLPRKLARIHQREDIYRMIDLTRNPKHRLLLTLCYGSGLRVTELVHVRMGDIMLQRGQVFVGDRAKGGKHRYTILAESVAQQLAIVCHGFGPLEYVFQGQNGGAYSMRSAEKVYIKACKLAGIAPTGIHTLRHSFATHLIEDGCDTKTVAELLGHESVKTTEQYIHLSLRHMQGVKSPMDARDETDREKLYEVKVA